MAKIVICKECGEEKPHCARGLCSKCYNKKWHTEHPNRAKKVIICRECGQEREHQAFGLCSICYHRNYRIVNRDKTIICKECGEKKRGAARGLCWACYRRKLRLEKSTMIFCKGCRKTKPLYAEGLCHLCYNRKHKVEQIGICEECGREIPGRTKGLCKECQQRKQTGICKECGEIKLLIRKGLCQTCYSRQYRSENPNIHFAISLKQKYGLTITDYNVMLEDQDGGCAICGKTPEENGRRLAVDHNHETGEVRGLLCTNCNFGLGKFQDDPQLLENAIHYLGDSGYIVVGRF